MTTPPPGDAADEAYPLSLDEYARYGRQMMMDEWGLPGQLKLKAARVAVIGAGGLGCPLLQYLAGAGVGTITIFDHDTVSASNLHRQVLHTTERVGMNKALSACVALAALNPHVNLAPRPEPILPSTALAQLAGHDLVVDCTDRPFTRYLANDAAVRLQLPLVSGAAIAGSGQWAVYGGVLDAAAGTRRACYRCLWPRVVGDPGSCADNGVWGPVTGLVGTAMASEVIKILIGKADAQPLLHLLHLGGSPLVRSVRMRGPSAKCVACGPAAEITDDLDAVGYDAFCGGDAVDESTGLVAGGGLAELLSPQLVLVDTRPPTEFGICALPHSTNIPLQTILATPDAVPPAQDILFICRRGNDSQIAAARLRTARPDARVRDVRGGLTAWSRDVDAKFPVY
ncbi:hypothetical protein VHUM_02212 [Vanrija humicola]|uniref:Rhodanese domain-containing protein n=1 Tax=Vanrija humicola TaxID=5417 RepID=A0A7D8V032_VANHU|nr:hypothetical protein VHUM_02212 [Vanrija humicola]